MSSGRFCSAASIAFSVSQRNGLLQIEDSRQALATLLKCYQLGLSHCQLAASNSVLILNERVVKPLTSSLQTDPGAAK